MENIDLVEGREKRKRQTARMLDGVRRSMERKGPREEDAIGRPRWSRGYHTRYWIGGSRVQTRPERWIFSKRKNPEYEFLRKGSKAVNPLS